MTNVIDWNSLMANSQQVGEPVPEGDYPAVAEQVTFGSSKAGDPQWKVRWRVIGGPHNDRRILDQLTLHQGPDQALQRGFFFRDMALLGLDKNFFTTNPDPQHVAQLLSNKHAILSVTINGNFNNVQRYQAMPGADAAGQQPQPQPGGFQPQPQAQPVPQGYGQQPAPQPQQGYVQPQQPAAYQPPAAQPQPAPAQGFPGVQGPMQPQGYPAPGQPQQPGYDQAPAFQQPQAAAPAPGQPYPAQPAPQDPAAQPQPDPAPQGQQYTPQPQPPF